MINYLFVIPAKAGIYHRKWIPAFAGMTRVSAGMTRGLVGIADERAVMTNRAFPFSALFLIITLLFLLSSCSYKAVYGENSSMESKLSCINIEPIETISGAEFTKHMNELITHSSNCEHKYDLETEIKFDTESLIVAKNSDVVLESVEASVKYKLKLGEEVVNEGKFNLNSSYSNLYMDDSLVSSPLASYVQEDDTKDLLAKSAANEILSKLILFFEK